MSIETTWTKDEFKAYLLLYAASGDMHITEDEKELIISKLVGNDFYKPPELPIQLRDLRHN